MESTNKHTLLIVEDNAINREMLGDILEADYDLFYAENGKVGLDILKKDPSAVSLVLLDLHMPVMGGLEMLDAMKADAAMADIPVIIVTANDSFYDEEECLEHGALDFISKPYDPAIVCLRVSHLIRIMQPVRDFSMKTNLLKNAIAQIRVAISQLNACAEKHADATTACNVQQIFSSLHQELDTIDKNL